MTAYHKTETLRAQLQRRDINLPHADVNTLRRAEMTLHRWAELECGDGNGYIERDEKTNKPRYFKCRARYLDPHDPRAWSSIPDHEAGALKRIATICSAHSLYYFHQTDPRGCALYVSAEPMTDSNYSSVGVGVSI